MLKTDKTRTVERYLGKLPSTTQIPKQGSIRNQMRLSLKDTMEARKMCLSFCYAGRQGNCASAGSDNIQVRNCLGTFRNKPLSGRCAA